MICKTMRFEQTLGNGKREGKIKQFQNEECASLVWKQNKRMKWENKLKTLHKAAQLHAINRT